MQSNKVYTTDVILEIHLIDSISDCEQTIDNINKEIDLRKHHNIYGKYYTCSTLSLYQYKEIRTILLIELENKLAIYYKGCDKND